MTSHRHTSRAQASTEGYANPFCVLGLSADAAGVEIQQAAQRALMERRLGASSSDTADQIRAIEGAQERLKDPESRFHAAMHWVTLNQQEIDSWGSAAKMRSLAFDQTMLTNDAYERIATAESVAIRNHNIAVLLCADAHRLAVQGEIEAAAASWRRGFERWALCLASEDFLQQQRERARRLEDSRLTHTFVSAELSGVPRRLLAEPAALASHALESRRVTDAVALVDMIRSAPFDAGFIDDVLETVYRPLARRVESEIDQLDSRRSEILKSSETTSSDTKSVRRELHDLFVAFKEHVAPDLEVMLELGDLPGLAEEHARDHASRFLEQLGLIAWNLADDAELAQDATRLANRFADAKSLKDKLTKSLGQLSDQAVLGPELEQIMTLAAGASAPQAIEKLKALKSKVESAESQKMLDSLIEKVSNHHALNVFAEAMGLMQRRATPSSVRLKLEEARRYARDAEMRARLDQFLQQIRTVETKVAAQQKTGCLVPIVFGITLLGAAVARGLML
ncbi:MAG: hypothetical protein RIG82_09185 [Phycisphaeraceae bacterium]